MSDFDSAFWSLFVAGATLVSIVACGLLLASLSRRKVATDPDKTGHVWDEDLDELNNPLPRWWIWLFWITIAYSLAYLWYYPGLGSFKGSSGWTSAGEYEQEVAAAQSQHGPLYARLAAADIATLAGNPEARVVGQRLFLNYCSQCHASDARGSKGFPNLADRDWLYGGEPEIIKTSILDGRSGTMPAMGAAVGGDAAAKDVANYVRSLSTLPHDAAAAARGKEKFVACAACHGPQARGNPALGAPNLADGVWLYGSSLETITETIVKGRTGRMPAHREFLGEERAHILAAYVYGLSQAKAELVKVNATK
jgi:cytochrome c oxidase cbb3-type subunit III